MSVQLGTCVPLLSRNLAVVHAALCIPQYTQSLAGFKGLSDEDLVSSLPLITIV